MKCILCDRDISQCYNEKNTIKNAKYILNLTGVFWNMQLQYSAVYVVILKTIIFALHNISP